MRKTIGTLICAALAVGAFGCKGGSAPANNAPANKPANTASNTGSSNSSTSKKSDKPVIKDEKKPEGKAKTAKQVKVPDSWVYVYDETKGYGFSVPEGSTGQSDNVDGIDIYVAATPDPSEITIYVLAYKNKELTKEDLLDDAVKFLEGMDNTVTSGKLTGQSDIYSLADASMTGKDGVKSKAKILVGTDVTDNYVMILTTDEGKFAANEKVIDEIWGSFEIWSGGAASE